MTLGPCYSRLTNPPTCLERDRAIAVEFELIRPAGWIVGQRVLPKKQHRFDEACLNARGHRPSLVDDSRLRALELHSSDAEASHGKEESGEEVGRSKTCG